MKLPDGLRFEVVEVTADAVRGVLYVDGVTHRCPPPGSGVMPCCDRSPFEVPMWHRLTDDSALVTCRQRKARKK